MAYKPYPYQVGHFDPPPSHRLGLRKSNTKMLIGPFSCLGFWLYGLYLGPIEIRNTLYMPTNALWLYFYKILLNRRAC